MLPPAVSTHPADRLPPSESVRLAPYRTSFGHRPAASRPRSRRSSRRRRATCCRGRAARSTASPRARRRRSRTTASAAYAFDFDLNYETVVAARGGKVAYVRDDSNSGGCDATTRRQRQLRRHRPRRRHVRAVPAPRVRLGAGEAGRCRAPGRADRDLRRDGRHLRGGGDDHAPGRTCTSRWSARRRTTTSRSRCRSPSTTSRRRRRAGRGRVVRVRQLRARAAAEDQADAVPRAARVQPGRRAANPILIEALPDQVPPPPEAPPTETPPNRRAGSDGGGCDTASTNHAAGDAHADRHGTGTATPMPSDTATPTANGHGNCDNRAADGHGHASAVATAGVRANDVRGTASSDGTGGHHDALTRSADSFPMSARTPLG